MNAEETLDALLLHEKVPLLEAHVAANESTSWFEKAPGGGLKFQTVGQRQQTNLIPLYKLLDERYSVYWKVNPKAAQG